MKNWIWLFLKLGILIAITVWLSNQPGEVAIEWQGKIYSTGHVGFFLGALGIIMLTWGWLWHMLMVTANLPKRIAERHRFRRREKGYRALSHGMVAVAAGDADAADMLAKKAEILLNEPPLTLLLSAQAAQLKGDDKAALKYFKAMEKRDETAFLGLRGQITQALNNDDMAEALPLARKAYNLQPDSGWVISSLIELEVAAGEYDRAEEAINIAKRAGEINAKTAAKDFAALMILKSDAEKEAAKSENKTEAQIKKQQLKTLKKGLKKAPYFTPIAVKTAEILKENCKRNAAIKIIKKAWSKSPHPDLAKLWQDLAIKEDSLSIYKWMCKLKEINPNTAIADLAIGEAAIKAKLWGEARASLEIAKEKSPHRGVFDALRRLEEKSNDEPDPEQIRKLLEESLTALPAPHWQCTNCNLITQNWQAFCPQCKSFNSVKKSEVRNRKSELQTSDF